MVEITIRKRPRMEADITQRKFFKKTARGKVVKGAQKEAAVRDQNTDHSFGVSSYPRTIS